MAGSGGNPFDQFDATDGSAGRDPFTDLDAAHGMAAGAAKGPNPFDQFDRPEPAQSTIGTLAVSPFVGFNRGLTNFAGMPVDAVNGAMRMVGLPVSDTPFGGSESIKRGLGYLGANPDSAPARNAAERVLQGAGEGVAGAVVPEAALAGLTRAGMAAVAPRATEALQAAFGAGNSTAATASNAAIGAAGGFTGSAAEGVAAERYKPLANLAGNLVGGGAAAVGAAGVRAAVGATGKAVEGMALTKGTQERIAGRALREGADNPAAASAAIEDAPRELVPGSQPTTGQLTDDRGLRALEEALGGPGLARRQEEQTAARSQALQNVQPTGAPEDLSAYLRSRLAAIDAHTDGIVGRLRQDAQDAGQAIGSGRAPEDVGAELRGHLVQAHDAARARESALWQAVDPDGRLTTDMAPIKQAGEAVYGDLPAASAAMLSPQESLLRTLLGGYRDAEPLRQTADLRSNLASMMRAERSANGSSPALRRMSQVMDAVQKSVDGHIEGRAASDNTAVAAGTMRPEDTLASRLAALDGTGSAPGSAPQVGSSVYTPSGRKVDVRYEVVDANDLTGSHTPDLRPNPAFPADLQPRDRTRAASELQINGMANGLQPERLGASSSAMEGAPIVGPDGLVESGNARVLALRKAYQQNGASAQAYRDFLAAQGHDVTGMAEPVLVRRRTSDLSPEERVRFAQESNASPGLAASATEKAATDAGRLSDRTLGLFSGDHDIGAIRNRPAVRAFLKEAAEKGEEGNFVTRDGSLSLDAAQRVRNALTHAAYGDSGLVGALAETGDENIRAFGNVMTDVAAPMARLRRGIDAGKIDPSADLGGPLAEAARLVQSARSRGAKLADAVAQQDAFSRISPEADGLLRHAYGPDLSGRLSRDRFATMLRSAAADAAQQTTEARLFGEPLSARQIIDGARVRNGTTGRAAAPNEPRVPGDTRAGGGEGGSEVRGPAPRPGGAPPSGGSESRILDRPTLEPNFGQADAARLKAASAATRDRASTFGSGRVGEVLDEQGGARSYAVPNSGVPGRLFRPGTEGNEAAQGYARAVDYDPVAMSTFHQAAAEDLRRTAMQPDGTLDPRRFEAWQRRHAEALRSLPTEITDGFQNAATASQTVADALVARRTIMDRFNEGMVAKLMRLDDGADVTKAVGGIFGRQDAVQTMRRLVTEAHQDPAALNALRRAVTDHVARRFLTEEGVGAGLQAFVRDNRPVLRQVLDDEALGRMQALANELTRGQALPRNEAAVNKGSAIKTVLGHAAKADQDKPSLLNALVLGGGAGKVAGGIKGAALGALGAGGKHVVGALQSSGLTKTVDLVREAMLDPDLARTLMLKVSKSPNMGSHMTLASQLRRLGGTSLAQAVSPAPSRPTAPQDEGEAYARGGPVMGGASNYLPLAPWHPPNSTGPNQLASFMGFASGGGVPDRSAQGRKLNTFSIAARCPQTGQLGIAAASAAPAVGSHCPFLKAGVGAVTTQSLASPDLAARVLNGLEAGGTPEAALSAALSTDEQPGLRQLGVVGIQGRGAAWTGADCEKAAGHRAGVGYSVQGNMLASPGAIDAMVLAFETSAGLSLEERLMRALEAGEASGGDRRGKQSAVLKIVDQEDRLICDLHTDKNASPVAELRRLVSTGRHQFVSLR